MKKRVYISWHYTTHGIAYLKHIFSAFYSNSIDINEVNFKKKGISQSLMNDVFEKERNNKGFLFDKV